MKRLATLCTLFAAAVFVFSGCGHMDLAREADPNRALTGMVKSRISLMPPPDAVLVVRVVQPSNLTSAPNSAAADMVIGQGGTQARPERVLAEQVIRAPASLPVPFRIEFLAGDAELRRGLNIDARISWGGKVRFRTVESQVVTEDTAHKPIDLTVEPVR